MVCFDILSSAPNCKNLLAALDEVHVAGPIVYAEYSNSELLNARLLTINSQKQCIDIVNIDEALHFSCTWTNDYGVNKAKHIKQRALFTIAKEPSTKTRTAFWQEDFGLSQLFTDQRVVDLVKENGLNGIAFRNVQLKNGSQSQNIFQITSNHIIDQKCIALGYGERRLTCPICGKEQFAIKSSYQLHLHYDQIAEQSDFYVTEDIFGEGIPEPFFLISQRFYRLLKENKLTGNLVIAPVASAD